MRHFVRARAFAAPAPVAPLALGMTVPPAPRVLIPASRPAQRFTPSEAAAARPAVLLAPVTARADEHLAPASGTEKQSGIVHCSPWRGAGPSHANGAVVGSDCMLAISFSVGYMGWHGEAGHDCAPLCEGGDGASCACRRAAQVGCTDVRASLSEVHPIRGAGSSLRRRVRGAVAGAAGLAVGGVQVRSPRPVDWLGQGGHRSKCGNSSLHTRAGLSRGTQCSGSGVSNDARARQRPWISAVSARADNRAA